MPAAMLKLTVVVTLAITAMAQDSPVSGSIADENGATIAGVSVTGNVHNDGGGYSHTSTVSDTNGRFTLPPVGRPIMFNKHGFAPLVYVRAPGEAEIAIRLDPAAMPAQLPACPPTKAKRYGFLMLFTMPPHARVKHKNYDDTWADIVSYPRNTGERMLIWSGPTLGGGGFPRENLLLDASTITGRSIASGMAGMDFAGASKQGGRWRSFSTPWSIVTYENVSEEAAEYFDSIIGSACWKQPEAPR